jgi:two-component system, NtrC family, response regulator
LREHKEDIQDIVTHYVSLFCEQYGTEIKGFSPDFIKALCTYDWPGNTRELVNSIEEAILAARYEPILFPQHLPTNIRIKLVQDSLKAEPANKNEEQSADSQVKTFPSMRDFRETGVAEIEKQYLENLLAFVQGNIKDACKISDLSRSRFYELLKKYSINV